MIVLGAYRMALTNALIDALTRLFDRPCRRSRRAFRGNQGVPCRGAGCVVHSRDSGRRRRERCRLPHCPDDPQGWRSMEGTAGCPRSGDGNHRHRQRRIEAGASVLVKESAYAMVLPLAGEIERYVASVSWRSRLTAFVARLLNRMRAVPPVGGRFARCG